MTTAAGSATRRFGDKKLGVISAGMWFVLLVRVINVKCATKNKDGFWYSQVQVPSPSIIRLKSKHTHMHFIYESLIQIAHLLILSFTLLSISSVLSLVDVALNLRACSLFLLCLSSFFKVSLSYISIFSCDLSYSITVLYIWINYFYYYKFPTNCEFYELDSDRAAFRFFTYINCILLETKRVLAYFCSTFFYLLKTSY